MRSRSSADAPTMLFQLAGSPVQRRGPRYTFPPNDHHVAPLPLAPPSWCHLFSIRASIARSALLMFCIWQKVDALPSSPAKAITQKALQGFIAFIITRLAKFYSASTSAIVPFYGPIFRIFPIIIISESSS